MRNLISTKNAPAAIGPYSQAIVASGQFVFSAGQLPIDPSTGAIDGSDIESQSRRALRNLICVLEAAGAGTETVVKTTVFLADMNHFAAFNAVYAEFLGTSLPARSAVQVARLPKDALVEIEAIALVR